MDAERVSAHDNHYNALSEDEYSAEQRVTETWIVFSTTWIAQTINGAHWTKRGLPSV